VIQSADGLCAVRADRVQLGGGDLRTDGTVRALEYHGASVHLSLDVAGAEDFAVILDETRFYDAPLSIGAPIQIGWNRADAHPLAS
jgi:putative spermidine/putrescine transport system ATP-binding protein